MSIGNSMAAFRLSECRVPIYAGKFHNSV